MTNRTSQTRHDPPRQVPQGLRQRVTDLERAADELDLLPYNVAAHTRALIAAYLDRAERAIGQYLDTADHGGPF